MISKKTCVLGVSLLSVGLALQSCANRGTSYTFARAATRSVPSHPTPPRGLAMFDGDTGRALNWNDVIAAVQWAEVTFLGERHNDAIGHAVQFAIVEDALADAKTPGALSPRLL